MPGSEKAFKKYEWEEIATHDIPYDVGSIMHYGAYVNIPFSDLWLLLLFLFVTEISNMCSSYNSDI